MIIKITYTKKLTLIQNNNNKIKHTFVTVCLFLFSLQINQLGCLNVSCNVLTTFDIELIISSLELNLAYIYFLNSSKLPLNSLYVLLWNSIV